MKIHFQKGHENVAVIGLGYVGLPLAVAFAQAGNNVIGIEVDQFKVDEIQRGRSYITDVPSELIDGLVRRKLLKATMDFSILGIVNTIIICVPTPLRKSKDPDISYILSALKEIVKNVQRGQLVVLESTTYPGTTREVILPAFEDKGFVIGKDLFLAFSPERIDPGNKEFGIFNTPKIIGGITPACTRRAIDLYKKIVSRLIPVSSPECAEMAKLLENTFRAVNIGLVNEVALMCDRLKLNVWEVIDAAATKPFGFMPFYPGPGIGGHCIPLDPQYLSWKLKSLNFYSRFIELAGEMNARMPEYTVEKINEALNKDKKAIRGAKVLFVGVSYKKDVGDVRESPALDVIELLIRKGARISYHDPYVPSIQLNGAGLKSVSLTSRNLSSSDVVVIATNHACLDIGLIVKQSNLIVDCRNSTQAFKNKKIIKL